MARGTAVGTSNLKSVDLEQESENDIKLRQVVLRQVRFCANPRVVGTGGKRLIDHHTADIITRDDSRNTGLTGKKIGVAVVD